MAHFAELDQDNKVTRVLVVANSELLDADGIEQELNGALFLQHMFGGTWVQTSYNGNIRKNFAGVGFTYDTQRDAFIPPQPGDDWVLNEETCTWEPVGGWPEPEPEPEPEPTPAPTDPEAITAESLGIANGA